MKYILTLLLLCGAAQACPHPDSQLVLDFEAGDKAGKMVHRRTIYPDDWCVGGVDTIPRWIAASNARYLVDSVFDTSWVLCCDSAARGLVKPMNLLDSLCDLEERYSLQTARHIFKCGNDPCPYDVIDIEKDTTFVRYQCGGVDTLTWRPKSGAKGLIDIANPNMMWVIDTGLSYNNHSAFPERWYIESVDTLWESHPHRRPETPCGTACIVDADTTWGKKIPLSEIRLTPAEIKRLLEIVRKPAER